MATGGEFRSGTDWKGDPRFVQIPAGEVRLCASCARRGIAGERLGLFEPG